MSPKENEYVWCVVKNDVYPPLKKGSLCAVSAVQYNNGVSVVDVYFALNKTQALIQTGFNKDNLLDMDGVEGIEGLIDTLDVDEVRLRKEYDIIMERLGPDLRN